MKKTICLILIAVICIIFLCIFLIAPLFYRVSQTTSILKANTSWISSDPDINIKVDDEAGINGTIEISGKTVNIFCGTLYDSIEFIDTDKEKSSTTGEAIIFEGECTCNLWKNQLTIEVTESNIDEIKSGDKIILKRQD